MKINISQEQIVWQYSHSQQSIQHNVVAAVTVLLAASYIAVVLRLIARNMSQAKYGVDDLLIVLSTIPITGLAICIYLATHYGLGKHILYIDNLHGFVVTLIIAVCLYGVTNTFTKISVLCFYCRVFHTRNLVRLSWVIGAFTFALGVAIILVITLQCIPMKDLWRISDADKCIDTRPALTALGIFNVVLDFLLLAIPIRFVLTLHMTHVRKLQIIGIFLTGALTFIFGIVRVIAYAVARRDDLSFDLAFPAAWAFCEIAIGNVAACLPTLGVFFTHKHQNRSTMASTITASTRKISFPFPRKSSFWPRKSRASSSFSRKSILSALSFRRSRPVITVLRDSGDTAEEKPWPNTPTINWNPDIRSNPELMENQQPQEPSCVLDVEIPSPQLHRHSGATDILTRFAPTMSVFYNHRWSRMSSGRDGSL